MAALRNFHSWLFLVTGLAVGVVGGILVYQSMPGAEGSPEERAAKLEVEVKRARNRIAALEAADPRGPGKRTLRDGLRSIGEDLREGRPVTPEDIFRASQPLMRDLAPLLERMRIREQRLDVDRRSGEMARKYDLTPAQQESLKRWFEAKSEDKAREWTALVSQEGTSLEDLMRASRDVRSDDGLDPFMANILNGEKLAAFQNDRMAERAERVQQHADTRTQRLDAIVKLDDAQRDRVFGIMAGASPDFDPSMKLEGVTGGIGAGPVGNPQQAVLAVLTPAQRAAYDAEIERRRQEAAKDLEAVGLSLPANWDPLIEDEFN